MIQIPSELSLLILYMMKIKWYHLKDFISTTGVKLNSIKFYGIIYIKDLISTIGAKFNPTKLIKNIIQVILFLIFIQ